MKRKNPEPGLFDEAPVSPTRVFVPTNGHNLLAAMASRLLSPLEGHPDKYYDDLLRFAPGRVPLVARGVPVDLIPFIAAEENEVPALVELDPAGFTNPEVPAFAADATPGSGRVGEAGWAAWAPAGPLPLAAVTQVHLRSDRDLEEFSLREFSDVRPIHDRLAVTPDLFALEETGASALVDWLASLPVPATGGLDIRGADRRSGALLLLAMSATARQADYVVDLLNRRAPASTEEALRGVATWVLSAGDAGSAVEERIVRAVLAEFEGIDRTRMWRPTEVVRRLRSDLTVVLDGDAAYHAELALDRADAILRSEIQFDRLREGGSPALKATLLALMRPEPERFWAWDLAETGADEEVRLVAAALVGALNGRSRLPVSIRPPALDDLLAAWECAGLAVPETPVWPPPHVSLVAGRDGAAVMAGEVVLRALPSAEPDRERVTVTGDQPDAATIFDPAVLDRPAARIAAIDWASEQRWWEAFSTVIRIGARSAHIEAGGMDGALVINAVGPVSIERELHSEVFCERIAAGEVPTDVLAKISAADETAPTKPRNRPRRARGAGAE